MSMY